MKAKKSIEITTQAQVDSASPGRHHAGPGLYLLVAMDGQNRRWAFRFRKPSTGKPTEMGLGSAELVKLKEARELAFDYRRAVARDEDPIEKKREARRNKTTFGDMVEAFIAVKQPGWRNRKTCETMYHLLINHASRLADKPICLITPDDVEATVRPLFDQSVDMGKRTLSAISAVFDYAENKELVSRNPADWKHKMKGRFFHKRREPLNFTAMNYAEVPEFVRRLHHEQQHKTALSPFVIEFLLLTACRCNEVTGMQWSEIENKIWTIPADRTKRNRSHRVPLSQRAVALLEQQRERSTGEFVWQTTKGKPIANKTIYLYVVRTMKVPVTVHGFRASFRTWARAKQFMRDICELALAHKPRDLTEAAYLRDDALEERRPLMDAWAAYLG